MVNSWSFDKAIILTDQKFFTKNLNIGYLIKGEGDCFCANQLELSTFPRVFDHVPYYARLQGREFGWWVGIWKYMYLVETHK